MGIAKWTAKLLLVGIPEEVLQQFLFSWFADTCPKRNKSGIHRPHRTKASSQNKITCTARISVGAVVACGIPGGSLRREMNEWIVVIKPPFCARRLRCQTKVAQLLKPPIKFAAVGCL